MNKKLPDQQTPESRDWRWGIWSYLTVLGPLLFLIYINDVTRVRLSDGTQLVLYADDILLYREIVCPEDYTVLQNDINTVNNWVKCNYLTF